jgi:hypothetical protein
MIPFWKRSVSISNLHSFKRNHHEKWLFDMFEEYLTYLQEIYQILLFPLSSHISLSYSRETHHITLNNWRSLCNQLHDLDISVVGSFGSIFQYYSNINRINPAIFSNKNYWSRFYIRRSLRSRVERASFWEDWSQYLECLAIFVFTLLLFFYSHPFHCISSVFISLSWCSIEIWSQHWISPVWPTWPSLRNLTTFCEWFRIGCRTSSAICPLFDRSSNSDRCWEGNRDLPTFVARDRAYPLLTRPGEGKPESSFVVSADAWEAGMAWPPQIRTIQRKKLRNLCAFLRQRNHSSLTRIRGVLPRVDPPDQCFLLLLIHLILRLALGRIFASSECDIGQFWLTKGCQHLKHSER